MEIEYGRRDWYKRMNEALMKEIQKARDKSKDLARYGV